MRDPFNRFALRYLAAVVCGLALLLLHSTAQSGLPAAFVPQCPSPWELSKLAFWPLLAAWVLTGRLGRFVSGKDVILHLIGEIGVDGALYRALEFGGSALKDVDIEGRLCMANMASRRAASAGSSPPTT